MDENKQDELLRLVRGLHDEMQALRQRVELLEASQTKREISEDVVCILSSAIAAYLGVKPRIRQIRLVRTESWAHQGRATIHASHALNR